MISKLHFKKPFYNKNLKLIWWVVHLIFNMLCDKNDWRKIEQNQNDQWNNSIKLLIYFEIGIIYINCIWKKLFWKDREKI